jgi:DNA polymerase III subunit delta
LKFQQTLLLQKHIEESAHAGQIPRCYLIVHPQREERKRIAEKIGKKIGLLKGAFTSFYEGNDWNFIHYKLSEGSLFQEETVIAWDGGKSLPEGSLGKILAYLQNPSPGFFLIIGVETTKGIQDLYEKAKKNLLFLDFSEEKPWDKEKRASQELLQEAKDQGKTLTAGALARLSSLPGADSTMLENELYKILAYVGDKKVITEEDVAAIGSYNTISTNWHIAEALIWGGKFSYPEVDSSLLLGLLTQIRFLLNQARQIGWLLEQKKSQAEIAKIANVRPTQLSKIIERISKREMVYFDRALSCIYQEEVRAKNTRLPADKLLLLLAMRLTQLKKVHTK